jgi:glycosyltransferase involved in cell wall biosynthesis
MGAADDYIVPSMTGISPPPLSMRRVSVVLPFRDAAATLPECLASITAQSLADFELLAIDDGSTDGSVHLVEQAARHDDRIRLLHTGGAGLVPALNLGLRTARSPLIARMDADDRMHPERLSVQLGFMQAHPEIVLAGCRVELFPEHALRKGMREYVRWQNDCLEPVDIAEEIYVESPFAHPSVMFRRDAVLRLGGYRDGMFPEDYDLWLRLHHAGHALVKLPETLLAWREGPGRASRVQPRYAREAFDALRAEYLARDRRLHSGRPLAYWGAGRRTRARARKLIDKGFPPAVWIDIDPRKIGNRVQGAPVVPPHWLAGNKDAFVLVYVCNHGARELIGQDLREMGYRRGRDFLMVG